MNKRGTKKANDLFHQRVISWVSGWWRERCPDSHILLPPSELVYPCNSWGSVEPSDTSSRAPRFEIHFSTSSSKPNSGDQTPRRERRQGKICFACSAENEQGWQPYPIDAQSAESGVHTHTHTHTHGREGGGTEPAIDRFEIVVLRESGTTTGNQHLQSRISTPTRATCNSREDKMQGRERRGNRKGRGSGVMRENRPCNNRDEGKDGGEFVGHTRKRRDKVSPLSRL